MRRIVLVLLMLVSMLLPIGCNMLSSVEQKALQVAVIIDGCGAGSGVIYQKQGNIYQVLTNRHVVDPPPTPLRKGGEYL
jgi:hypothetical protein